MRRFTILSVAIGAAVLTLNFAIWGLILWGAVEILQRQGVL